MSDEINLLSDIEKGSLLNNFDEISDMQPSIHDSKKSWIEIICKLCSFNSDLTKKEYKKFNVFKKECIELYDTNNPEHEKILIELLDKHKSWKKLGFQTENPRTDFRAGGVFSLKFMHYFSVKHYDEFIEMINMEYFLFAIICIKLSYLFRLFINLVKDIELENSLKSHNIQSCSRKQFKIFCRHLNYDNNVLYKMLSKSLIYIKNKFKKLVDDNKKELNILLFDDLIKISMKCLGFVLNEVASDYENTIEYYLSREYNL